MAHVRIYRRALSQAEIREDMDTDRLALAAFRRGHPIGFSLSDKDENYVLYIGDDPRDHHHLNLELRNTSAQAISSQKQGDTASRDNHHFELVFRNGVLSDKTLKKLRENKEDVIVSKDAKGQWDLFCPPREDSQTGTVSVYFLYKDTSKLFGPNESLIIPLRNISANAGSGARGTRVELKPNQLTYDGETTPITGSRIQHLQIISHLGSRRVPLHVGFVGSNRILNDGSSANTLVLQLMNVLKSEGDTSVTLTKDSEFLISFDVQSSTEVAPWSLCKEGEIEGLKANDSIIVAQTDYRRNVVFDPNGNPVSNAIGWKVTRTDHGQGESPVWSIAPKLDIVLQHDDYIQIYISNIKTSLPSGLTNLYLDYRRIPGFWDGQVVCMIEKAPLLFYDAKNQQGTYTGELRVGIGAVNPQAKLEIAMAPKDANTKPLVIRRDSAHYLTVLHDGRVGIGKALPEAPLDVNGEIRANFFRAGEGHSRRLPIGSPPAAIRAGTLPQDGDAYWYRIAKIASPKPQTAAGAEFSLRAIAAGRTAQVLTFRLIGFAGTSPLSKKPQARFVILSNTGSAVFSKLRIVLPPQTGATAEGYLEIFTRHLPEGEADVSFAIYDNLDIAAWQPVAWEKQATTISGDSAACEHSLDRLFMVADTSERLAVDPRGAVLIIGKVGIGTPSPKNQLHVGSGSSSIKDDRVNVVVASESQDAGIAIAQKSGVNVLLQASEAGGYLGTSSNHPLVLRTKDEDRVVVDAEGNVDIKGSLTVKQGERLDVIQIKGRADWGLCKDHPIMQYFSQRLRGKPVGTMLRAITDYQKSYTANEDWRGHWWTGWVDATGQIRVIHNHHNTQHIAPQNPTEGGGVVVYAD